MQNKRQFRAAVICDVDNNDVGCPPTTLDHFKTPPSRTLLRPAVNHPMTGSFMSGSHRMISDERCTIVVKIICRSSERVVADLTMIYQNVPISR